MHYLALPLFLALLGADDAPRSAAEASDTQTRATMREWQPENFVSGNKCRDSNLPTADNPGQQPRLERGPATPGMGQYLYAVDRRIDGCSVVLAMSPGIQLRGQMEITPEEMAELLRKR
ncbi:hypothetical protein [Porphyrobacter sp. YT40]|uniref:hypothetical protein n=1 Tax=Porphyrobacter sp. YT40 TaxID=2547601 RepID=UPI001141801A|nr:hypothetical protein [Porphyrobacter sp. YT40]QDH34898.1 hypothetical protein E2E27_11530 [Porphyrobacter sp. YT40]